MSPQVVTCADRAAWLRERASGEHPIGSSDVPRILGTSRYGGPWSVWRDRFQPVEDEEGEYLDAGLADEPRALAWYAWERPCAAYDGTVAGVQVDPVPWAVVRRADAPWMTCSPDAIVALLGDSGVRLGGVEIKHLDHEDPRDWAPTGAEWRRGDKHPCPRFIVQQAYWCSIVCETPWWDICAALWSGRRYPDMRIYRIYRDEVGTRAMVSAVAAWRERHLVQGEEPPYDTPQERMGAAQRRYPAQLQPLVTEADAETAELLAQLGHVSAERKAYEDLETQLRAKVCEAIGDGKAVQSDAWRASWSTSTTVRRLSGLSRIETDHPDLVAELERRGLISTAHTARRLTLRARKA